ncbi:MAG TPA: LpqB family beta-propeller domain-containing protein, partial [Actinomycetes bacterium]|nr:LpqB family beta-propeller domain-containing protein [Actinomycetes bacterium]
KTVYTVRAAAVGVFAATLLLTGCASIPTSGSVHSAEQAAGSDTGIQQDVQFYPEPPADGASAEQIVRGFLDASGAVEPALAGQPDFATARKYLASDDPKDWQPGNDIQIYDGSPQLAPPRTVTSHSDEQIDFEVEPAGTIDSRGTYTPASPGKATKHYTFDLVKVKGQRRIDRPLALLLISKSNFDREYESLNLYFFDPSSKFLVPDPIYLAKRADRATLLVRGLLQGPSYWLSSAVEPAFPSGVKLTQRGVRVVGGQAVVDLSKPAGLATRDQQNRFGAQLVRTLAQLQISSVTVTVEGKASPLTDLEVDKVVTPPPEPDAYGLRDGALYALPSIGTDDARAPEKIAGRLGSQIKLVDFAVQPGSGPGTAATIAGIDDQTQPKLYIAKGALDPAQVKMPARHLESPTWDRAGRLWVIDQRRGRSAIVVIDQHLRWQEVTAADIADRSLTVQAIAVSEDGTRLALVTTDPQGRREAQIATVEGSVLTGLRSLAPGLSKATDVAWRGPAELVILGTQQNGQLQPYLVSVDGSQLAPQGTVENPLSVTATRNRPILVGTRPKELWAQSGGGTWERVDQNIAAPRYPG